MDRKTLIFVISLSLSLMLVNTYFEYRNYDAQAALRKEEIINSEKKIDELETFIAEHSVTPEMLPLAEIYSDPQLKKFETTGILINDSLLTLEWDSNLPKTIYIKGDSEEPYHLISDNQNENNLVIYSKSKNEKFPIARLPSFGHFELIGVTPSNNLETTSSVVLFEYVDGQFKIPEKEIVELKGKLGEKPTGSKKRFHDSILLYKTKNGFYPAAYYSSSNNKLTPLTEFNDSSLKTINQTKNVKNKESKEENFYILENGYQQLVFSSYGGALAEINLPFQKPLDEKSVVKEIEFDRDMVEHHPYNAYFPAHPFFTAGENEQGPYKEHEKGSLGGYYPLLRRDLIQTGQRKSIRIAPKNYATNIVSEYPEIAEMIYEVKHFDKNRIVFEASDDRRKITKTYTLNTDSAPYVIDLTIKVEGDARGLWLTSGIPEVELISGAFAPALKYRITRGTKSEVKLLDLPVDNTIVTSLSPDWLCNSNGFFGIILDPLTEVNPGYRIEFVPGVDAPTRIVEVQEDYERFKINDFPGYQMMVPLAAKGGTMKFRLFTGPFSTPILKEVDAFYTNAETGYNPDYIACQTFHGWFAFISEPFAKFLFFLMNLFHTVTGSWGLSIILLTVALRIMMYPLNAWSTKSMLRTQEFTPKIQAIQQKYKNDPKKAQIEILNFYKENGINPVSGMVGGCFPLLIQMPFLIGMFDLLKSSFQLRGASFIPGWIDDLAAPDVLFSWSTPIPLIGNEFHLLPILLGVIMFFQPRMMSSMPADKSQWSEQQRQQRTMGNIMAVMFTWLFYSFPSGLNIYWGSSMLLGMAQQWWNKRNIPTASSTAVTKKTK